ncbi:MAG TPA: hypothetical protein VEF04_11220, partial [Blastocatellia bacterium]|nr:hypothetical protein [Blastocatellia bacterium]
MQCSIHSGAVIYSRPLIAANNGDIPGRFVVYLKNGEWQAGSRVTLIVSMGQSKGTVESIFGVFSRGDLGRAAVGQVVMQTGGRTVPLFSQPC